MKANLISSCVWLLATQSSVHASIQVPFRQAEKHRDAQGAEGAVSLPGIEDLPFKLRELKPIPLAVNGDPDNRVDLVFFGDGYTTSEHDKFLHDAQALTDTLLSPGGAFATVRDMLNFWAVFIPSLESGIGTHGVPKNTTFGLYRPGEELRAVFYAYPERVTAACEALNAAVTLHHDGDDTSKGYGCDEPILLANDAFYGGLGGTPTVITASPNNGVQVLRHELGHTLIPAGEEYDGGYAYFGVNAATLQRNSTQQTVPWQHWVSDPKARRTGRVRLEDSRVALQAYPVDFTLSEGHRGSLDRTWVQIPLKKGLAGSTGDSELRINHTLVFTARVASSVTRPMLSSVEVIEYGSADKFNKSVGHIGAYQTVDIDGGVTLRPTNEGCLMRDVTPKTLDHEGPIAGDSSDDLATISLRLLPMANSSYSIHWAKGDEQLPEFTNRTSIQVPLNSMSSPTSDRRGRWYTARIKLRLPHVRVEGHEAMEEQVRIWFEGCTQGLGSRAGLLKYLEDKADTK
ncbi:hypothetical protein QFC21_002893 [Naganishia friedmannii]|uniref:Uncharacterized protein n=1 Tax=Naganishia friedmannii TaxID=89922 RepID=A0ACC2VTH8_9TREE|nr:hypothetical protein QFC21_002893 [Naganishia friedmannii]